MQCPTCDNQTLSPTKLEHGLPALSCKVCNGVLLSILSYRDWLDREPEFTRSNEEHLPQEIDNTKHVIVCTKCNKLMAKYKVAADLDNQIDLCLSCADVWFDNGEWNLLAHLGLQDHFTTIFNTPWQTRIREKKFQTQYLEDLEKQLGSNDFEQAQEFRNWLEEHKHKQDILHFLTREFTP